MNVTDRLRGWYAAAPPSTRALVGRGVSMLPASLKYGSTFAKTHKQIKRTYLDVEYVEHERLALLNMIMSKAAKSDYYNALFHNIFGEIPKYYTFDMLQELPILTKDVIRKDAKSFLTKSERETTITSTSGSSGKPLTFYMDKERGAKEFAYITSFWERIGFDYRRHTRAVLRGVQLRSPQDRPWEYDAALKELRLSPFHMSAEVMREFIKVMTRYHVDYIHGYPSSIVVLADFICSENIAVPPSLKGILPVSEPTHPHQLQRIMVAFPNCTIMKYYGMSEKSLIAPQIDADKDIYSFEPLYGFAELVDFEDKAVTTIGRTGRIIGTGFISTAMPLLRYDTEDVADFVCHATKENFFRMQVSHIQGRWGEEYVLGYHNELVSMSAINIHSAQYDKLQSFQLYQQKVGEVEVHVVPKEGILKEQLMPFCDELQKKVGNTLDFTLRVVDEIHFKTKNGKRPFIRQELDLTPYIKRMQDG